MSNFFTLSNCKRLLYYYIGGKKDNFLYLVNINCIQNDFYKINLYLQ